MEASHLVETVASSGFMWPFKSEKTESKSTLPNLQGLEVNSRPGRSNEEKPKDCFSCPQL